VTGRATTDTKAAWFEIDTTGREIASVHAHADTAILLATGPSLERWTLQARRGRVNREVLDATPQKVACDTRGQIDVPQRFLWTFGADGAHKHDVRNGRRDSHDFGHQRRASELVFVVDPDRRGAEDGGWIVGLVHDAPREVTDFVVLDAQFVERPPVALVHIPRRVPNGTHATWFPAWSSSSNATYDPS
jgi:carotenoid cleavage dioxygenase-like enzyme